MKRRTPKAAQKPLEGSKPPTPDSPKASSLAHQNLLFSSEASRGGMKVGRTKDPFYKDHYLGIAHLPSGFRVEG